MDILVYGILNIWNQKIIKNKLGRRVSIENNTIFTLEICIVQSLHSIRAMLQRRCTANNRLKLE